MTRLVDMYCTKCGAESREACVCTSPIGSDDPVDEYREGPVEVAGFRIDPETGEILNGEPAPDNAEDTERLAEWIGNRKAELEGKLAALRAERAAWEKKLELRYDAEINALSRSITWLCNNPAWVPQLRNFAERKIEGEKKRSFFAGLLRLGFRTQPGRYVIQDEDKAIAFASRQSEDFKREVLTVSLNRRAYLQYFEHGEGGRNADGVVYVDPVEAFYIDGKKAAE